MINESSSHDVTTHVHASLISFLLLLSRANSTYLHGSRLRRQLPMYIGLHTDTLSRHTNGRLLHYSDYIRFTKIWCQQPGEGRRSSVRATRGAEGVSRVEGSRGASRGSTRRKRRRWNGASAFRRFCRARSSRILRDYSLVGFAPFPSSRTK